MKNKFSSRIKELRTSHKMTQIAFAKSIGTSQNALSGYETGDRVPSYDILLTIATKYNISLDWLCGITNKSTSDNIISTYSDIIFLLTSIANNSALNIEVDFDPPNDYYDYDHESNEQPPLLGTIRFDDSKITTFLHDWQEMLRLLKNDTIKEELYKLWLNDQLNKYDIPITHENRMWEISFLNLPDEELPFA